MSVVELQELEEVKGLLANGRQVGVLTYSEISLATSELDLDESDVEELHGFLERWEIELVEEVDPALAATEVKRAPDKRGRRAKTALDLKPDMTTDSLQLFLKDIAKVRLLTAQDEVDLAKRIERGDLDAKQKMVESNLRLVVSIAKNYRNQGRLSTRLTITMQVADDDASVPWELLRVVSGLRSELVDATPVASSHGWRQAHRGVYRSAATESHGRPTSPTTVTTSTASRSACFWSRLPGSSQRPAESAGCAMIQ